MHKHQLSDTPENPLQLVALQAIKGQDRAIHSDCHAVSRLRQIHGVKAHFDQFIGWKTNHHDAIVAKET
jgi:hypothetical protein